MTASAWGAVLGLVGAGGLLLIASWVVARRPLPLAQRIGPFVGTASDGLPPYTGADRTSWRTVLDLLRVPGPRRGGPKVVLTTHHLGWLLAGAGAGAVSSVLLGRDHASLLGVVLLGGLGALTGYLLADRAQAHRTRTRRELIDRHLPVVAELLAFSVAAGESPQAALDRVSRIVHGPLADEVALAVVEMRAGSSIEMALSELADRCDSASVRRFVDGLLISLERGTPVADVLRAQAADCRADERRRLLELAGRKDVLMLVPVVFFVLPCVVLIALYPGIESLRLIVS